MGTLDRVEAVIFEDHYITCKRCAAAVEDADHYVRAMKVVAQRLRGNCARATGSS